MRAGHGLVDVCRAKCPDSVNQRPQKCGRLDEDCETHNVDVRNFPEHAGTPKMESKDAAVGRRLVLRQVIPVAFQVGCGRYAFGTLIESH